MRKVWCFLAVIFLGITLRAGESANFSRVKIWNDGDTLTAGDLNAEFNNILNNLNPAGNGSYSATLPHMRAVENPYPGNVEVQAVSLQDELEQLRFQILGLKQTIQASSVTYWYQAFPPAGTFTIAGSSVGVNNTAPAYAFDVTGTGHFSSTMTAIPGVVTSTITTTQDPQVTISTNATVSGNLTVGGIFSITGNLGPVAYQTNRKSSNFSLDTTYSYVVCDTSGGSVTITLPALASVPNGQVFFITRSGGNSCSVTARSGELINGASGGTKTIAADYNMMMLIRFTGSSFNAWDAVSMTAF